MAEKAEMGNIMTSLGEFIRSNEWNDVELLYLLATLRSGYSHYPFAIEPAGEDRDGLLIYEPTGDSLRLTTLTPQNLIPKIEKTLMNSNLHYSYENWKIAVERMGRIDEIYREPETPQHTEYFDNCLAVFQGGGCKAVAYVGAYDVAYRRGVIFNELAGTSAGSIIAALIAAGAKPNDMRRIIYKIFIEQKVSFTEHTGFDWIPSLIIFILSPILWLFSIYKRTFLKKILQSPLCPLLRKRGMFSTAALQDLIEKELQNLTGLHRTVLFKDITPTLYVVASDTETNCEKIWSKYTTPDESVAKAVCASCAIPFFFQPVDEKYVDGGLLSNSPTHIFNEHATYNRVLNFQLCSLQTKKKGFFDYLNQIVNTIIDGAVLIQTSIGNHAHYPININIEMKLNAIDFKKVNSRHLPSIVAWGQKSTEEFFRQYDNPQETYTFETKNTDCRLDSEEKMYALIASYGREKKATEIHISTQDSTWAWILFPTLLKWRIDKTKVVVYLPKDIKKRNTKKKYEDARRRLLRDMGCFIKEEPEENDILGFFAKSDNTWSGVFYQEHGNPEDNGHTWTFRMGRYYNSILESKVIQTWVEKLRNSHPEETYVKEEQYDLFSISSCSANKVRDILKMHEIYKDQSVQIFNQEIEISDIFFLSNYIRLEKYRQIKVLFDLYKKNTIPLFEPAEIQLLDNKSSIITPIILERHKERLYVVEGKTRLKYAYQHGITKLNVFVINGVKSDLPIVNGFEPKSVSQVIVTDNKKAENMQCVQLFRHIEEMFHPSDTYLL